MDDMLTRIMGSEQIRLECLLGFLDFEEVVGFYDSLSGRKCEEIFVSYLVSLLNEDRGGREVAEESCGGLWESPKCRMRAMVAG